jgi:hypothetical protein
MPNRELAKLTERLEDQFEDIISDGKDHQAEQNDHAHLLCNFQKLV